MTLPLDRPVFVVGHPRSGTTLLATVLGRNSELAMPAETQFFMENPQAPDTAVSKMEMGRMLESKRVADLALDHDDVIDRFMQTDRTLLGAFASIIDSFREKSGKARAGEKSPPHLEYTETLLDGLPGSRIVCIERDGADVIGSLMRMPWSHRKFSKHVFDWCQSIDRARVYERSYPGRFLRVSFSQFTMHPEEVTRKICHFCELPFEPTMLESSQAETVPAWEKAWKEGASMEIRPTTSTGEDSFSWMQRAIYLTFARSSAEAAGYATERPNLFQIVAGWARAWPYHPRIHPSLSWLKSKIGP